MNGCWWIDEALAREAGSEPAAPALRGDVTAEVCIVGGGYTGLWTAIRLRERDPSLDVVVIDRDECGLQGRAGGTRGWRSPTGRSLRP